MVEAPELVPVLIHGRHGAKVGLHPALHGYLATWGISQKVFAQYDRGYTSSNWDQSTSSLLPQCCCGCL